MVWTYPMTNLAHVVMYHVTNHLIISNDKDFNTENLAKIYASMTCYVTVETFTRRGLGSTDQRH
jgi:hypothetical protein